MFVLKHRNIIFGVTIVLTILAGLSIPKMKAKYNFEEYFPQNDSAVHFYKKYSKNFDSDAQLLLLGLKNEPSIFDSIFLKKVDSLTQILDNVLWINRAIGITTLTEPKKTPFGFLEIPMLKVNRENYHQDSINISRDPRIMGSLISKDFKTTCILLEVKSDQSEIAKDSLISYIDEVSNAFDFQEFHLGGDINTEVRYIRMLEAENLFLIPLFLLATVLVLMVLYRSFFSLNILTVSVLVGLIWLFGYAAFIGRSLNIATLMFPTIMVVVGMSDLIHFYTKYNQHLANGLVKIDAIKNSLSEIQKTLFLTSLTTAIGFITLSFSSVPHVKTFGLDATVGVWMAFLIAITVTPILLSFLPTPRVKKKTKNDRWNQLLVSIEKTSLSHSKAVIICAFLLLIVSLFGISKLDTNSYLLGNISENSEVRKDFQFFENELSGVRALEMQITAKPPMTIDSLIVLKEVEKLEEYLGKNEAIGPIFSPVTFYKSIHKIQKGGRWKHYELPSNQSIIDKYRNQKGISRQEQMISKDRNIGRLTAKMKDLGRLEIERMNTQIDDWISENIDTSIIHLHHTGSALLIDKNNEHLVNEMFQSLGLAFLIISILMAYLFRDIKMVFISLIPNMLPLIVTAGYMGFMGIELNGSSAIIFTISFVIAVDDTIHFLSKFRLERSKGFSNSIAISNTMKSTGKAIIITSLILAAGYSVCLFSEFREAYYHGVLICFTLLWALVADLFLLPVLLRKLKG